MFNVTTENKGSDSRELDQNVDGWTRGVLEWITNSVSDDSGVLLVLDFGELGGPVVEFGVVGITLGHFLELLGDLVWVDSVFSGFLHHILSHLLDFLLAVVPGTTGVGGGDGDLDTGDDDTSEETGDGFWAEDETSDEWGEKDEGSWSDHHLEGGPGGDGDALLVVWLGAEGLWLAILFVLSLNFGGSGEVLLDEDHHFVGSITDGLHGHGGESVWEHSTDHESTEWNWGEDIDLNGSNSSVESTEKGETDEAGGSDSETLTNSSGGVTSSIEGIGLLSDSWWKSTHLSNTTGIVGNWSVSIDGKSNWEGSEHTEGSKTNTVHTAGLEGESNGGGEAANWDDAGKVSESKTLDDVWSWSLFAVLDEVESWSIGVAGVVLGGETDDHTRPESEHDATVSSPLADVSVARKRESLWKEGNDWDQENGHDNSRVQKLELQNGLNVFLSDLGALGEENGEEGSNNTSGGDHEWEVKSIWLHDQLVGGGRNDEGGAGGLSEGSEKISSHTGNVTNVVTDVIGNSSWVAWVIFSKVLKGLTNKISTDIGSLSVDTTTDSSEKGDGGTTKTVSGNELEKSSNQLSSLLLRFVSHALICGIEPGSLERNHDKLENKKSKSDKNESKDLSTSESSLETDVSIFAASISSSGISKNGNSHTNISSND